MFRLPLLACVLASFAAVAAPAAAQSPKPAPPPGSGGPIGAVQAPGSSAAPAYKPGELLVGYERGASSSERSSARRNGRVRFRERLLVRDVELVETEPGQSVRSAAAELRRQPRVRFAEPNYYRHLDATTPNDGLFGLEWGLHNTAQGVTGAPAIADADIDAPEAWDFQRGSAAVKVAVIDTGIQASHRDLDGNIGAGYDFVDGDAHPQDLDGHGTHVAGTIGAEGNDSYGISGVVWDVELMPLRVFGAADHTTDDIIVNAFQWAADQGARVANASLGGSGGGAAYETVVQNNPNTLYVVSAGNGGADSVGDDNDVTPQYPCNVTAPNLICVAASNQSDRRASFSNYGSTSVDIAAPGTEIASTYAEATQVWHDTFEYSPLPYTTSGAWGYHQSTALNWTPGGAWSLADSPSGSYAANSDTWAQRNYANLSGLTNCDLSFKGYVHSEPGYDFLRVEVSSGGGAWTELARYSGISSTQLQRTLNEHFDLGAYSNRSEFWLRFRFTSDGDNASIANNPGLDGAFIDEVVVECNNGNAPGHVYLQGTSMASPHVAGVAALLFSQKSSATVQEVRQAILDNGDPVSGIPTVTNKRLNAYGALLELIPPNTTITSAPPALTNSTSASFGFTTDQTQSTFECSLDGAAFSTCAGGRTYTGLSHGSHTFRVRTRNRAGVLDGSPAAHTWTVDTQAPDTTITSHPAAVVADTTATFAFSSSEAGATFECALDFGSYEPCASPRTYTGLAHGRHTFRVRSTDPAGNVDPADAVHEWVVDTQAPDTEILSKPPVLTSDRDASFGFSSTETGATFQCSLDGAAYAACSSPKAYSDLPAGEHTFRVRSVDGVGNVDASEAVHTWTIDTSVPDTTITAGPPAASAATTASFTFSSSDATAAFECSLDGAAYAPCTSPATYDGLSEAAHTFSVRAVNGAGTADPDPATHAWTVDVTAPAVTISAGPQGDTESRSAEFGFSADDPAAAFECRLTPETEFTPCSSPRVYDALPLGEHTFTVRARDAAGNVGEPAGRAFRVVAPPEEPAPQDPAPQDPAPQDPAPQDPAPQDPAPQDPQPAGSGGTPPPLVDAKAAAAQVLRSGAIEPMSGFEKLTGVTIFARTAVARGRLAFRKAPASAVVAAVTCAAACEVTVEPRLAFTGRRGKRLRLPRQRHSLAAGAAGAVRVRFTASARKRLRKARRAKLVLAVGVRDAAGTRKASRSLRVAVARRR